MKSLSRASTGIPALDEIIDGLRIGDNVVWQVDEIEDYRMVARAFVERALAEGKKTSYFRFARHASLLEPREGLTIHSLDAVSGFETFSTRIHTIITEEGEGAFYVFDCLSDLLQVWATDLMVGNFFMITCPYLFELKTVAYFAIESASHAFKTVARIRETTQVLLDAYNTQDSFYIQPLKVWKRYSPTMFLPHRQQADCFTPVTNSIDATRLSTHMSRRWEVGARRNLDYWDRLFLKAAELTQSPEDSPERARMVEELCRIMMVREPRMSARRAFPHDRHRLCGRQDRGHAAGPCTAHAGGLPRGARAPRTPRFLLCRLGRVLYLPGAEWLVEDAHGAEDT